MRNRFSFIMTAAALLFAACSASTEPDPGSENTTPNATPSTEVTPAAHDGTVHPDICNPTTCSAACAECGGGSCRGTLCVCKHICP